MLSSQTKVPLSVGIFGGMGPLTGYDFFKLFVDLIPAKSDTDHPDIDFVSMASIPRKDRCIEILEEKGKILPEQDSRPGLKKGMDRFKFSKVNFVVVPCNTFHYFREELQAYSGIEILNMISIVLHSILAQDASVKRVGLLSTKSTAKYKIYDKEFNKYGIEVIKPTEEDQDIVLEVINLVKESKQDEEKTEAKLIKVIKALEMKGVDYIILGCTELPLVKLKNYQGNAKLVNSTLELAKAAASRVCKEMKLDLVKFEALVKSKENKLDFVLRKPQSPFNTKLKLYENRAHCMFYKTPAFHFSEIKKRIGSLKLRAKL